MEKEIKSGVLWTRQQLTNVKNRHISQNCIARVNYIDISVTIDIIEYRFYQYIDIITCLDI